MLLGCGQYHSLCLLDPESSPVTLHNYGHLCPLVIKSASRRFWFKFYLLSGLLSLVNSFQGLSHWTPVTQHVSHNLICDFFFWPFCSVFKFSFHVSNVSV